MLFHCCQYLLEVKAGVHIALAVSCRWAYAEAGWSRIASLAPAVLQCAEEGDSIAFKIVTSAAHEALEAVIAVATRTKLKSQRFKLVLSGAFAAHLMPG